MTRQRVAVIENQKDHLAMIAGAIGQTDRLEYVGHARSVREATVTIPPLKPDILIIDFFINGGDGVSWLESMDGAFEGKRILFFTINERREDFLRAIRAGATGYLLKGTPEELHDGLAHIENGGSPITPSMAKHLLKEFRLLTPPQNERLKRLQCLTDKQRAVLEQIAAGKSYKEAAEALSTSVFSIRNHISRIYEVLGVETKAEAKNKYSGLL